MTKRDFGPRGGLAILSSRKPFDILRTIGVDLRPHEARVALALFTYSFLLGTFQFAAKAVRQASYIDTLGAEQLPWVYLLVAVVAYPVIRVYGLLSSRCARGWTVTWTVASSAAILIGFWMVMDDPTPVASLLFYLFISIATVLLLSQLWSVANALLDARQARRLFGFIGSGGLLGGVAGGQIARYWAALPHVTLLVSAILLLLIVAFVHVVDPGARSQPLSGPRGEGSPAPAGGLRLLLGSNHLLSIASILFVSVIVAQVIDLQFNWLVERATSNLAQRTALFGNLFSIMGIAAFLVQLTLTGRIYRRFGVGQAMRILPLFILLVSLALAVSTFALPAAVMLIASVLKAGDTGLRYSLDHASRELLFVPVASSIRVQAKALIDVLVHRFAKGAAAVLLLTVSFGWLQPLETIAIVLALCVFWIVLTFGTQRRYVAALRRSLQQRSGGDDAVLHVSDAETLKLLVESLGSAEPRQVLRAIDVLSADGRGQLVPTLLLHHADAAVRRRALRVIADTDRQEAIPLVEQCLGDDEGDVRAEAVRTLATLRDAAAPVLMRERLGDPDPRVQAAAIACLAGSDDAQDQTRVTESLDHLSSDDAAEHRLQAASALAQMPDSVGQAKLVGLLYDRDARVVRAAVRAVRLRLERDRGNPIYVPTLVSLLRDRRVKHGAREALVAAGDAAIPAMRHFMLDSAESLWVRRALPKTLARFDSKAAVDALFEVSSSTEDHFLRRKVIEALGQCRRAAGDPRAERLLVEECRRSLRALFDLQAVSDKDAFSLSGPYLDWRIEPDLLQRLLAEQRSDHLENALRLLVLYVADTEVVRAREHLLGARIGHRMQAIEYFDNVVPAQLKRPLMVVLDDLAPSERASEGERIFGVAPRAASSALRALLEAPLDALRVEDQEDDAEPPNIPEEAAWLAAAAAVRVWRQGPRTLLPLLRRLRQLGDEVVGATASWVVAELEREGRASAHLFAMRENAV